MWSKNVDASADACAQEPNVCALIGASFSCESGVCAAVVVTGIDERSPDFSDPTGGEQELLELRSRDGAPASDTGVQ
jgi:hypothetical protein